MKIIEELKLNETIEYISRYEAKHKNFKDIYENINDLNLFSIQAHNFQFDREFFDEVSFVLSVIITIINHPHILSYDKDEIIRAELAGHVENDSFQMVFKEPRLWKDKDGEMVPEEVYYHEHIDEIRIYENIFIGMLINLIEQDLKKSLEFYVSLLPTLGIKKELSVGEDIKYSINKIEKELKKIRFIKDTSFYKIIKTCNLSNRKIIPTNILLKDRLYNYCFKFYKKFIRYDDALTLAKDFTKYFYYLLLQVFKKKNAVYTKDEKNHLILSMNDFSFDVSMDEVLPMLNLKIQNGAEITDSLLCALDVNTLEKIKVDSSVNYDVITIWNLYDSNVKQINKVSTREKELVNAWLDSKIIVSNIDKEVYSRYCPICKSHSISIENDVCTCSTCNSIYTFTKPGKAWFIKVKEKSK